MNKAEQPKLATHIVVLNYFSIIFITLGVLFSFTFADSSLRKILYLSCWIYLVPPLLARLVILFYGKPTGIVSTSSRTHTIWWILFQLQLIFNRFTFLEEILRIIPGLYAVWLNIWGAKVNLFSFWAPGVTVMDRYHINIGKGVIIGTNSLISAHVLVKKSDGSMFLIIDSIIIEPDVLIGVAATISPGCHIHQSQIVPAQKLLKPYTEIKDNKQSLLKSIDYR
jgi:hypothetical protein